MASSPGSPSNVALQAALDGNFRLLRKMAKKLDLRGAKDAKGRDALHFAASKGCLESCKFLVEESGFDVNSVSAKGETPMLLAAMEGNVQVLRVRYLLDRGGDPATPDDRGETPLHNAAEHGHCEAVKLLLSKEVDVDPINYRGTPLHLAAAKDQDQAVKILLEHGADPNRVVNHIFSPLMMACCGHSLKCMKLLIEAGADANGNRSFGPTPLTEAVDDGSTDFVKFLIEAGADPNIPNEDAVPVEERIADLKSQGKEAFAKAEYLTAIYFYGLAMEIDPLDATLFANRSLCWLRMREGGRALLDAEQCKMLHPGWSKAWYREGAALSFLEYYEGAVDALLEALKLDPGCEEIKKALREAIGSLRSAARSEEKNPSADI